MLLISLILLVTVCEGNSIFKSDIKIFDYLSEYDYTNNQPDLTCFTCDKSQSNEAWVQWSVYFKNNPSILST